MVAVVFFLFLVISWLKSSCWLFMVTMKLGLFVFLSLFSCVGLREKKMMMVRMVAFGGMQDLVIEI